MKSEERGVILVARRLALKEKSPPINRAKREKQQPTAAQRYRWDKDFNL